MCARVHIQMLYCMYSRRSRNMQCQKLFQASAPINCVCLHPNQAALVIGDQTGALHLWDLIRDTSSKVVCVYVSYGKYCVRSLFGGDFNLAAWRFFVRPPNLNDANIVS